MKKQTDKKSYYAIIPADVRYDPRLTASERLLFGEITALCSEKGFCWASNAYFAKLYDKRVWTISRWISHLIEAGYIRSVINKEAGNRRQLYLLPKKAIGVAKKPKTLLSKKAIGIDKKGKQNNTDKNRKNTKDNFINKTPSVPLSFQTSDERHAYRILQRFGVSPSVAHKIVFGQRTALSSIEQAIKNGLAKAVYTTGFVLEPGYIVATLNKARNEAKLVGPTRLFNKLYNERIKPNPLWKPMNPKKFEETRQKLQAELVT